MLPVNQMLLLNQKMSVDKIIDKVNRMIDKFIDNSCDTYKVDFKDDYVNSIKYKNFGQFVDFITHDFLFCEILHGEKGGKYDIREYHSIEFSRLLDENIKAYSKIVEYVDKYFKKYPDDACERLDDYSVDTILKYYAFVYTKTNLDLFVNRNCPKYILDAYDYNTTSDEEDDDDEDDDEDDEEEDDED
jgi:hypothetical protein